MAKRKLSNEIWATVPVQDDGGTEIGLYACDDIDFHPTGAAAEDRAREYLGSKHNAGDWMAIFKLVRIVKRKEIPLELETVKRV